MKTNVDVKKSISIFLILATLGILANCASKPIQGLNVIEPLSDSEYTEIIKKNTSRANKYKGFYQSFQADLTILTNEAMSASLKQKGAFLQWDEKQYQSEREKSVQEAAAYSKFFLRFFAPEKDYDDLSKAKTIWKIYLEFNGTRFEGKVKKLTDKLIELQTLYPHMDRFSTPYEITFNVPMSTVETGESKVVLSSSLGSAEFVFPVKK